MSMKTVFAAGLGLSIIAVPVWGQNTPPKTGVPAFLPAGTNAPLPFKDQKERLSYSIGMNVATSLKRGNYDVDLDLLISAIKDVMDGQAPKMTDAQAREAFNIHNKEQREKQMEEMRKTSEKNHKEGEVFMAANKAKDGVKTATITLAAGATAEMQYKVVKAGTGQTPKSNDTVTVSYHARLIDGKEFENSTSKPKANEIQIPREMAALRGVAEALKMMPVGSEWEVFLPSTLAFADRPYRGMAGQTVEPGSTVIYDIELQSINVPTAPVAAQPLTSDIIRVPSADEIKAGRKVEVLKPEDVARMQAQATNGTTPPKQ